MDIGTAKPTAAERASVAHHLLDLADPRDDYSVAEFQEAAGVALAGIAARGHRALLVGGTGLYLRALVDGLRLPGRYPAVRAALEADDDTPALHARLRGLDPRAAGRIEPTNRRRVVRALEVTLGSGRPFSSFGPGLDSYPPTTVVQIGLRPPLDVLDRRIGARVEAMVAAGFVDEVRALPRPLSRTAGKALGYRELLAHLDGEMSLEQAVAGTVLRTRQFARRQLRWFRRDPRVQWWDAGSRPPEALGDWRRCA
jgi:tRNA dimethylallyltransferase